MFGFFSSGKEYKRKINKLDLIKFIFFSTAKETIDKMKEQFIKWEKIFTNEMTDKHFISKIYKWLTQLNIKEKFKMSRRPEQTFFFFFPKNTYRRPAYT